MATWTTIADARLEPDKPARSIDALALRDNPIAIAENAANAPKVNQYYLLITTSTTWTVPKTGQYWIDLIGGGGGGGSGVGGGSPNGGGGGGSGYVASKMLTLTQGDTYPIVIGIAGSGGVSGGAGAVGAATTGFGLSAAGGGGGAFAGAGGTGHSSGRNGSVVGGAGGSAPLLTPGINATGGAGAGGSGGFGYGAGGGGGGYGSAGGAGAQGAVIIRGI